MINQAFVDKFFPDIVGQSKVKRQLAFYINSFQTTQMLPHLLVVGQKGGGKTALATLIARNLSVKELGGSPKPMLKINCATVRKLDSLVNHVFIPHVKADSHITLFFDECHALDDLAQDAMLTALNPDKRNMGYINYKESLIEFDFKRISFVFATTNAEKMSNPLKDRLRQIQLEPYTVEELGKIIKLHLFGISVDDKALENAALTCRGNARQAVKVAQDQIVQYCSSAGIKKFNVDAWDKMSELLSINPLGVSESELQILRVLDGFEGRSLTALAAATGLEKAVIMGEFEPYLLKLGLIEVGQKGRMLTISGKKYLKNLKASK
jgi:Holliday junction resolvasome RuvABC ATP-dependent DNA helicase subunit